MRARSHVEGPQTHRLGSAILSLSAWAQITRDAQTPTHTRNLTLWRRPAGKRADVEGFFSAQHGVTFPPQSNPADVIMDAIAADADDSKSGAPSVTGKPDMPERWNELWAERLLKKTVSNRSLLHGGAPEAAPGGGAASAGVGAAGGGRPASLMQRWARRSFLCS